MWWKLSQQQRHSIQYSLAILCAIVNGPQPSDSCLRQSFLRIFLFSSVKIFKMPLLRYSNMQMFACADSLDSLDWQIFQMQMTANTPARGTLEPALVERFCDWLNETHSSWCLFSGHFWQKLCSPDDLSHVVTRDWPLSVCELRTVRYEVRVSSAVTISDRSLIEFESLKLLISNAYFKMLIRLTWKFRIHQNW